jgi:cytochrome c-type biogenesis protein CcmH
MKTTINSLLTAALLLILPVMAQAKEATPMSADPAMEKLVNEISAELRCLVCQNQTIADSHAELAVDLKNQVRTMVAKGQTQDEILDYMVTRYGDFVRYRPPVKPTTYLLWAGPLLLLITGFLVLIINLKKRKSVIADAPLSEEEHARIDSLLKAGGSTSAAASGGEDKQS